MQAELERLFERVVFGQAVNPADPKAVEALLDAAGIETGARAAFREEIERLVIYRKLVRGTLHEALELAIPRTLARLEDSFERYLDLFLDQRGPATHFLRDVTPEFLEFCLPLWKDDARVPAYAADLARHESLRIEIGAMPVAPPAQPGSLDLDRGLTFTEASRVMRYEYAIQRLSAEESDRSLPAREPTALFVYRSPEHDVRYLELTPLAANILERLLAGDSLRAALTSATGDSKLLLDQAVLEGTARLLADLSERGAVLGAK